MNGNRCIAALVVLLVAVQILDGSRALGAAQSRPTNFDNRVYIVEMSEAPVVSYRGEIRGYPMTKPAKGRKIDPGDPNVVNYVSRLDSRHGEAMAVARGGRKLYDYRYTFNGFAAELTKDQAAAIARAPGVLSVNKDELQTLATSSTPTFLGLDAPGGLWEQLGGFRSAGEDVIIGVLDGGIWPESLSFSDRTGENGNARKDGKLSYHQIPGWHGRCEPGESFNASHCNQKLIGARYYNAGWGGNAGIDAQFPWEFNSPRDYGGHGTFVASTAGGNHGVAATGSTSAFGTISGMAPRARIAMYKVSWFMGDWGRAWNSDIVAAIDQAVADGVDIINLSLGGSAVSFRDSLSTAFMHAADAGVFVAAGAGNSGPFASTVANPAPWITTVAAGTHNRRGVGSVTLGNGAAFSGASVATPVGSAPLIDAAAAGLPGADPWALSHCIWDFEGGTPGLDPAKVAGKIVVCDSYFFHWYSSVYVREAGGVGMILVNENPGPLDSTLHFLPTVHLADIDRAAVKAYASTPGPTATIAKARMVLDVPAPYTASFSSRGPLRAGGGDLLKPDLIAPGQDILAAISPTGVFYFGDPWFHPEWSPGDFSVGSGTSFSTPHVAGVAALLKSLHPDWSPMMIKSALMTTAYDVLDGSNTDPLVIFSQGAGHVRPNGAADPGLVFDSGSGDWLGFLCGTGLPASNCASAGVPVLDPSDLNMPSIAIGDLVHSQTVTRKVTNVGRGPATYTASFTGMDGFNVSIAPASMTLSTGQTGAFSVAFTRTTASLNAYTGGQLTWRDGIHDVRIPMVARPVPLAAPGEVSGSYSVKFGYSGAFNATARGLIPATMTYGSVPDDPTDTFTPGGPGTVSFDMVVPPGTTYARFSLFDANVSPASDLDLYVYRGATYVGGSGSVTSAETVSLVSPAPGTYTVWVHGYGVPAPAAAFTLFSWMLGTTATGNMVVAAPNLAVQGQPGAISLNFSGLASGIRYLGSVAYSGATGLPNPTIVRVDP